jgi:hypothetical protein
VTAHAKEVVPGAQNPSLRPTEFRVMRRLLLQVDDRGWRTTVFAKTRGMALLVIVRGLIGMSVGGIAWAAIPDSAGVIHGCYANKGGALRVIDTATTTSCKSTEQSLTWNQQGIQGPAGQQGPQGPKGDPA